MLNKDELRKSAKEIRKNLDMEKISAEILQIFFMSDYFKNAKNIAFYYPYGSELDLRGMLVNNSKEYYLPKSLESGELSFHKFKNDSVLKKDCCGILAPISPAIDIALIDLFIIPALMVDKNGKRLGYGKGFYDKLLSKQNLSAKKIVCIPDELYVEKIPADDWDVSVDIVITQSGIVFSGEF